MSTMDKEELIKRLKEQGYIDPHREIDTSKPSERIERELDRLNKIIRCNERRIKAVVDKITKSKVLK